MDTLLKVVDPEIQTAVDPDATDDNASESTSFIVEAKKVEFSIRNNTRGFLDRFEITINLGVAILLLFLGAFLLTAYSQMKKSVDGKPSPGAITNPLLFSAIIFYIMYMLATINGKYLRFTQELLERAGQNDDLKEVVAANDYFLSRGVTNRKPLQVRLFWSLAVTWGVVGGYVASVGVALVPVLYQPMHDLLNSGLF